jgi:hypothetical protein
VLSVEPDGIEPVYDITVDSSHEFVAELVPVHNCNCYEKNNKDEPTHVEPGHVFALRPRRRLGDHRPVNWYAPSSTLKLMFDRLVCINGAIRART